MIPVRNVYYMLSYAFRTLNEQGYRSIETEEFHNIAELCAAILSKGIAAQLKRGLGKEYISETKPLSSPRGKIDIADSVKGLTMQKGQLVCTYDDFSVNSYMNRIIKTTMLVLLKAKISSVRKKELRKLLIYFEGVDVVDIHSINWNIQYNRNNQTYRMLVSISYLVIKGLLQTQSDGSTKLMDFIDDQRMHRLYEKFILEYYRKEHPELSANASQIPWQLDDDNNGMLPLMQSDITLRNGKQILIIDAKYYSHSLQIHLNHTSVYSFNLYQIFTYVKNMEGELSGSAHKSVSGMLLYAQTDYEGPLDLEYKMSGNRIAVKTLDLSVDFSLIREQLDSIVYNFLPQRNA